MAIINRHNNIYDTIIDKSSIESSFDRRFSMLQEYVSQLQHDPHSLALLDIANDWWRFVCRGENLNKNRKVNYQFLFFAYQFSYNACLLHYYEEVELIFGKTHVQASGEHTAPVLPVDFLPYLPRFINISIILRDHQAQLFYAHVVMHLHENLMYAWRSHFVYVQMLQSVCSGNDEQVLIGLALAEAFERREMEKALDRNSIWEEDFITDDFTAYSTGFPAMNWEKELCEALNLPVFSVLRSIFENDEQGFNKHLQVALEQHRSYYEGVDEYGDTRTGLPEGWLSLPLIAACSLAHQRGLNRSVTSDYIPEWMVRGEFEGLPLLVE